ncbi:MAG: hypothetical protein RUMPE_00349 [Eubacteriales bacterium SKADARSKE-1]|nr:hypothetical protein [Eubacteriales bacterium SKADARSKE-1]
MDENKIQTEKFPKLNKIKTVFKTRKFKHSSAASAITVLFVAIIVVLNIIVGSLGERLNLSWDLTSNKAFTLTDQSINFLNTLNKDVEIILLNDETAFASQNEYFSQANTVLKQYAKHSNKIKLTYMDLAKNPTFIQSNYPDEELNTNSIIVKSSNKYKIISVNDIFDISYGYYGQQGITASKAEQEVTAALVYVTSDSQTKIVFLKGYGEQDYSAFSEILKKNNYDINEISLLTEDIPNDISAVIIFGPDRDYDTKGIAKLEQFLSTTGKNLVYAPNPNKTEKPIISDLLNKWGIKVKSGIVYETNSKRMTSNMSVFEAISDYVDSTYTENLKTTDIPVLIPACKPLEVLDEDHVKVLLQYSETSGIMPIDADKNFDFKGNISGPIPSTVISSKTLTDSVKPNNVAVIGSFVALTPDYLSATSLNNSTYFTNMLNVMLDREDVGIIIESKTIGREELGINAVQANTLGLVFAVFIPIMVLTIGTVIILKRKHK